MHRKVQDALESSGVSYRTQRHEDLQIDIRSPHDFARALGYDLDRITKTLLLRSTEREEFIVVVLSINKRVQLEKIAELLQTKRVQMATKEELSTILDYRPTGVSPLGANPLSVIIDSGLMVCTTVLVGSGETAVEIEISPQDLVQVTDANVIPIAV